MKRRRLTCPQPSKVVYRSERDAEEWAHTLARKRLGRGELVEDLYVYRCRAEHYHLSRQQHGQSREEGRLVLHIDPELQRWAVTKVDPA